MTFGEFKNLVKINYKNVFPKSACDVSLGALDEGTFFVTYYLAENNSEFPNGISQNDLLGISFFIGENANRYETMSKLEDDTELPQDLLMEVLHNRILTKPDNKYMAYGSVSLPYRKTKGTPEKIVDTLKRYAEVLKTKLIELYEQDKIPDDKREFVASKLGISDDIKNEALNKCLKEVEEVINPEITIKEYIEVCPSCREEIQYKFDPLGKESDDIDVSTGHYILRCPQCDEEIEIEPKELDLEVAKIDEVSKYGFLVKLVDKNTGRHCWFNAWKDERGYWDFDFNQFSFNMSSKRDIIARMFQKELDAYTEEIGNIIGEIADEIKSGKRK